MSDGVRLLSKNEYSDCIPLFIECFGNDAEFMDEYFGTVFSRDTASSGSDGKPDADICTCSGIVRNARIAALFENGCMISMVHILPKSVTMIGTSAVSGPSGFPDSASPNGRSEQHSQASRLSVQLELPYLMGVCTSPGHRHKGCMDKVMNFCIGLLRSEGFPLCFLVAVNRDIYRHLNFLHDWRLTAEECELLYADDGLDIASACLLNTASMPVLRIL